MERSRRGKRHAAHAGSVNVLSGAPYGYRYIGKHEGDGEARYQVRRRRGPSGPEDLRVGRPGPMFDRRGLPSPAEGGYSYTDGQGGLGPCRWFGSMLKNPAYKGDGGLRQDAIGAVKAPAAPAAAGSPRATEEAGLTESIQRSKIRSSSMVPALVERGAFRCGPSPTRREPAAPARPVPRETDTCYKDWSSASGAATAAMANPRAGPRPRGRCPMRTTAARARTRIASVAQRLCWNKQVRTDLLDAAVWEDVRSPALRAGADPASTNADSRKTKTDGDREVDQ